VSCYVDDTYVAFGIASVAFGVAFGVVFGLAFVIDILDDACHLRNEIHN
jgi:hypothetical protein